MTLEAISEHIIKQNCLLTKLNVDDIEHNLLYFSIVLPGLKRKQMVSPSEMIRNHNRNEQK